MANEVVRTTQVKNSSGGTTTIRTFENGSHQVTRTDAQGNSDGGRQVGDGFKTHDQLVNEEKGK